ncbi:class D sortase [Aneurinibacillus aneurinilyticus]|jgi:sortase A|nr:class D sortase [Aneurinibacillus aneurinilyticus]ERI10213.1 sortase family protein [Aneurinibacillus aneurinilyticus ATCC 12856]MCI1694427.1 class D sortase [Aneurinibacillus aneurinilyticus]MED0669069.1 class D sortase [Aneurinibacillus aneurinilyticus]MED0709158.1 class D sortase [Aneurinibacillus aneurinilyticus]MED0725950.1 class D sortase [Aneurinibacillus aneurinilyticus]
MAWSVGFLITGLFLLFYPQIEKEILDAKQKELIEAFEQLGNTSAHLETASTTEVQANQAQDQIEWLDGARGVIRIPKIDLQMLIFEGANETSLSKGIGMIEPEKEFGINNVGLAGHRAVTHGRLFNRLDELAPNDEIEIKTKTNIYEFVIVRTFVVDRKEVGVLTDKKEPYLTLVTCTPIGKKNPTDRLIVQAKLKNKG